MRILLVEDNRELAEWLGRLLRKSRYVVDCVHDGVTADAALATQNYDLVLLDRALPEMSGIDVLRRYRGRKGNTPIIIITADDSISSRISGLDGGADDYLVKPFDPFELEARIRALIRRGKGGMARTVVFESLSFNTNSRQFDLGGTPFPVTAREHAVLETLILSAGRVVPRSVLNETVFGLEDETNPNALEIYIHRLRKKLEGSGVGIRTLRGLGYAMRKEHAE